MPDIHAIKIKNTEDQDVIYDLQDAVARSTKADKSDTVLDTTLSRGRKSNTTVGVGSFAFGNNVTASESYSYAEGNGSSATGTQSHAEGLDTVASGQNAHAEGGSTVSSGANSHAEGSTTTASGVRSHAENLGTIASGANSHVSGKYNVVDSYSNWPEFAGNTEYEVGDRMKITTYSSTGTVTEGYICKTANSDSSFDASKWIRQFGQMNFAEIIGNGSDTTFRSNARALDWNGNEYLAGNVYVNCGSGSTGGNKLSTVSEVDSKISDAIRDISAFDIEIVDELPTEDIREHTFYLVPVEESEDNLYKEYLYIDNEWELVGSTSFSPLDIIDDNAGSGDLDRVWSANKLQALEERLSNLEYVPIALNSLSVSPRLVEKGATQTSASLTYSMNRNATQMQLDNADISDKAASGTISLTGLSLTSDKTWVLKATDERKSLVQEWVSKSVTMTFTNKVKYGVAAVPASINDAFLNGLATRTLSTGKVGSFSVNAGSGQYIWYALPSSYGICKFTVGGFTGGFALVATFNHQNESGFTTEYNVYRSDNANLGAQSVSVS